MGLRNLSIFQRLLYAIAATALLAAAISGGVHYLFSVRLLESALHTQMHDAMSTARVFMDRAYHVPVSGDLRLLEAAPVVSRLLTSRGADRYVDRLPAERMFQSVLRTAPDLYTSLTLLDADGIPRAAVFGARRMRADAVAITGDEAALFRVLSETEPGSVRHHGPLRHADGRYSMLVGITKTDPDLAGFGGAIIAQISLDAFLAHLAALKVFEHRVAWLLDAEGNVLLAPPSGTSRLDPRGRMTTGLARVDGGTILASALGPKVSPLSCFRVVLSAPEEVYVRSLYQAGARELALLAAVMVLSTIIASLLARQITRPVRALSEVSEAVGRGDFTPRIVGHWGGEIGRLAGAFNRMLETLDVSTVSRAYMNQIIESMDDAVMVVDRSGSIETLNRSAVAVVGVHEDDTESRSVTALVRDDETRAALEDALANEQALRDVHTTITGAGGVPVPVWLNGAPMRDSGGRFIGLVLSMRDISEHLRAQRELEAAHQVLSFHVHNSPLAVIEWDPDFRIRRWSGRAEELFGWKPEEVVGRKTSDFRFIVEEDLDQTQEVGRRLKAGEPRNFSRNRNYRKDGSVVHCEWHNSLMLDADGRPISVLSLVQDVTESAVLAEELAFQAAHDSLTGLMNRRAFERRLGQVVARLKREGDAHALCFVDMDQFKVVNDTCGHIAGDELLRQVAGRIEQAVRRRDTVARLGGDEFVVLMEDCSVQAAQRVAAQILERLREQPFLWDDKSFRVGASIGLVPVTGEIADTTGLLSAADAACLAAKELGRDRVQVLDDYGDLRRRRGEAQWVVRLNRALDEERFVLLAQPMALTSGVASHVQRHELLLRLRGEDGELIAPGAFLPSAERYHLMPKLDRWVIRKAIELLASAPRPPGSTRVLFVNISGQTLADESLCEFVASHLARAGVPAGCLCFEITETAAVSNFTRARALIQELTTLGCEFALDDFGAGVSSFAYLKNLPVHYLKIDGMFVRDIVEDPANLALVRSINEVGHAMGKRTVAEFVENESILAHLRAVGVDFVQGFHIGRPLPAQAVLSDDPPVRLVAG